MNQIALEFDEVPVGAVIVCNNQIIARGHNYIEHLNDVTAHAEMQAFTSASDYIGGKYLRECTLYVTLEPCVMCAGIISNSRIRRLYFGASDMKSGGVVHGARVFEQAQCHHKPEVYDLINSTECEDILKEFFKTLR